MKFARLQFVIFGLFQLLSCNSYSGGYSVEFDHLLNQSENYLNQVVKVQGYTPGIPPVLYSSKDAYSIKTANLGVRLDLLEYSDLNNCVVGDIEIVGRVVLGESTIKISEIESIQNIVRSEHCSPRPKVSK